MLQFFFFRLSRRLVSASHIRSYIIGWIELKSKLENHGGLKKVSSAFFRLFRGTHRIILYFIYNIRNMLDANQVKDNLLKTGDFGCESIVFS